MKVRVVGRISLLIFSKKHSIGDRFGAFVEPTGMD